MVPLSNPASSARLIRLAEEAVARAHRSLHVRPQAGIGSMVPGLPQLPRSRREADQVLRVLAADPSGPAVATIDHVRSKASLLDLADGPAAGPQLRLAPLTAMLRHDAERQTGYAPTLLAFLEAFGDITAAAGRIGIHQNTFRYRLRRIAELFGINLDDPDELLVLWLQLRLTRLKALLDILPGAQQGSQPGRACADRQVLASDLVRPHLV
jgi:DNA-binding PucR family transcriptional regulator